jgi:hypothetical protein
MKSPADVETIRRWISSQVAVLAGDEDPLALNLRSSLRIAGQVLDWVLEESRPGNFIEEVVITAERDWLEHLKNLNNER